MPPPSNKDSKSNGLDSDEELEMFTASKRPSPSTTAAAVTPPGAETSGGGESNGSPSVDEGFQGCQVQFGPAGALIPVGWRVDAKVKVAPARGARQGAILITTSERTLEITPYVLSGPPSHPPTPHTPFIALNFNQDISREGLAYVLLSIRGEIEGSARLLELLAYVKTAFPQIPHEGTAEYRRFIMTHPSARCVGVVNRSVRQPEETRKKGDESGSMGGTTLSRIGRINKMLKDEFAPIGAKPTPAATRIGEKRSEKTKGAVRLAGNDGPAAAEAAAADAERAAIVRSIAAAATDTRSSGVHSAVPEGRSTSLSTSSNTLPMTEGGKESTNAKDGSEDEESIVELSDDDDETERTAAADTEKTSEDTKDGAATKSAAAAEAAKTASTIAASAAYATGGGQVLGGVTDGVQNGMAHGLRLLARIGLNQTPRTPSTSEQPRAAGAAAASADTHQKPAAAVAGATAAAASVGGAAAGGDMQNDRTRKEGPSGSDDTSRNDSDDAAAAEKIKKAAVEEERRRLEEMEQRFADRLALHKRTIDEETEERRRLLELEKDQVEREKRAVEEEKKKLEATKAAAAAADAARQGAGPAEMRRPMPHSRLPHSTLGASPFTSFLMQTSLPMRAKPTGYGPTILKVGEKKEEEEDVKALEIDEDFEDSMIPVLRLKKTMHPGPTTIKVKMDDGDDIVKNIVEISDDEEDVAARDYPIVDLTDEPTGRESKDQVEKSTTSRTADRDRSTPETRLLGDHSTPASVHHQALSHHGPFTLAAAGLSIAPRVKPMGLMQHQQQQYQKEVSRFMYQSRQKGSAVKLLKHQPGGGKAIDLREAPTVAASTAASPATNSRTYYNSAVSPAAYQNLAKPGSDVDGMSHTAQKKREKQLIDPIYESIDKGGLDSKEVCRLRGEILQFFNMGYSRSIMNGLLILRRLADAVNTELFEQLFTDDYALLLLLMREEDISVAKTACFVFGKYSRALGDRELDVIVELLCRQETPRRWVILDWDALVRAWAARIRLIKPAIHSTVHKSAAVAANNSGWPEARREVAKVLLKHFSSTGTLLEEEKTDNVESRALETRETSQHKRRGDVQEGQSSSSSKIRRLY